MVADGAVGGVGYPLINMTDGLVLQGIQCFVSCGFLVLIFCTYSRQVSVSVLLQTFIDQEAEALDMFGMCLSSCRD